MQERLLINQARYVDAGKSSTTIPIDLSTDKDVIVNDQFNDVINQYNVYLDERENCTKIRLIADVNLLASNIIFNSVTEIVKNEGSDVCKCLNYEPTIISSTIGKKSASTFSWGENISYAIKDTQITWDGKEDKNYTYLCGIDIFDNHILRSKTKYASHYNTKYDNIGTFNTIDETLTDFEGMPVTIGGMISGSNSSYRRYTKATTLTFLDSINKNLIDRGGWVGFLNKTQMHVTGKEHYEYGTERVLNNQTPYKFIDLFPGRDRYSLLPHYNQYRDRYENNWDYCLTYPCSSTTECIPFINKELDTLKIAFIDETEVDDDGIHKCIIYSISKHGLNVDDSINFYRSSLDNSQYELIEGDVTVDSIIDDYTFSVITNDYVCKNWVSIFDNEALKLRDVRRVGENEYRVSINSTTPGGYIYSAATDTWVMAGSDVREYDTVFAVNDYLNLDYDQESEEYGEKYFPYKRFADWLMYNYAGVGSSDSEVEAAFESLSGACKITATRDINGVWIPDESCLTTVSEAIETAVNNGQIPPKAFINLGDDDDLYTLPPTDTQSDDCVELTTDMAFVYIEKFYSIGDEITFNSDSAQTLFLGEYETYPRIDIDVANDKYYYLYDNDYQELESFMASVVSWYLAQSEGDREVVIEFMNKVMKQSIEGDNAAILINRLKAYFYNEDPPYEYWKLNSSFSPDGGHTMLTDTIRNNYVTGNNSDLIRIGSKNLSFAKVVDGVQCKYYVRIMSRFPNFDFYDKMVNEENIYSIDESIESRPIDYYSNLRFEKQSTISRIGFSKNIYGDDMCQIVYNDDIDLYAIRDNLGRPLTSVYLSFFKSNYGYKEWYGKGSENPDIPNYKSKNVEWSRCFGKLKCGFEYSPHIQLGYDPGLGVDEGFGNIHFMNDVDYDNLVRGLNQDRLGGGRSGVPENTDEYLKTDFDEINYRNQKYFYGDLCVYSPAECIETSIQDCCNRFNTAQREIGGRNVELYVNKFSGVTYTDVFNTSSQTLDYDTEPTKHPEGLYYHQNYEIPIRTFSETISEFVPDMIRVIAANVIGDDNDAVQLSASNETYYDMNAKPWIYNTETSEHYKCDMVNALDINILVVKPHNISSHDLVDMINSGVCLLYNKTDKIPGYAEMMPKNSGVLRWRELVQNGFEDNPQLITEYPFTNGALYVTKDINIFVRRQDPFGLYGLSNRAIYYGVDVLMGEKNEIEDYSSANADETFREQYIKC